MCVPFKDANSLKSFAHDDAKAFCNIITYSVVNYLSGWAYWILELYTYVLILSFAVFNIYVSKVLFYFKGGIPEEADEKILHAAFIPFGDIMDIQIPLDYETGKGINIMNWT